MKSRLRQVCYNCIAPKKKATTSCWNMVNTVRNMVNTFRNSRSRPPQSAMTAIYIITLERATTTITKLVIFIFDI